MSIDTTTLRAVAQRILGDTALSSGEADAITQLAYLAEGAELKEDPEAVSLTERLVATVCELGTIPYDGVARPSPLPSPDDDEARVAWLARVVPQLRTTPGRELGYVVAYLVMIGDLQLAPVESVFLDELRRILGITEPRAADLVGDAATQLTPAA